MTQPQTNPTNPANPTDPINPAIPANPDDANTDPQTEPQTVAFEQTSVTDPATGDTVTETIATEDAATADAGTASADMPAAPSTFGTVPDFGATAADAPAATDASTPAYAQPTASYTQQPAVDSMGNPYAAASTSSPYEHAPAHDAAAQTMPMGAYAAPGADYGAQNAAQQPYANYGAPNGAQPQPSYAAPATYYVARNKILAGLLAFFFGMFGIHNFYLGYTGRGIAQLLLTVLGWIALGLGPLAALIWSWIEGVRILTSDYGTPEHRDARGVELMD